MTDLFSTQNIIHGDCLDVMREMDPCSIDCIVTDPPYGLSFMGKDWDHGVPGIEFWKASLRVLKPGGHLLAFGGTRTYHRLTCAIEDAGFEIRDCMMWVYGSGFPKSHNISKGIDKAKGLEREVIGYTNNARPNRVGKETKLSGSQTIGGEITLSISAVAKTFDGYGTALKPAYEPIIVAMRPLDGTFAQNAEKWGVGGINVDACRVGIFENDKPSGLHRGKIADYSPKNSDEFEPEIKSVKGRWPANLILDEEAAKALDEMSCVSKSYASNRGRGFTSSGSNEGYKRPSHDNPEYQNHFGGYNDSGGSSRFFYCPKASSSERNKGLEENSNTHPTVKPIKLMEYLLKLVMPPFPDAVVLDPFAGSGSTLVAAKNLGFNAIGIEKESEYVEIANRRIA